MKYDRVLALGLILLALGIAPARANLVLNPGFEAGSFTNWTGTGSEAVDCSDTDGPPHSGNCEAALLSTSNTLTQTITTVSGDTYTLDFWLYWNVGPAATFQFEVAWNGNSNSVISSDPFDIPYTDEVVTDLTATGASTVLEFESASSVAGTLLLDDVTVVDNADNNVPEPASLALFGAALAGFRLFRRRRNGA